MSSCSVAGCNERVHSKGLCNKHYQHNRKYGTPFSHTTEYGLCRKYPKEWNSYRSMKMRCLQKTYKGYQYWGGRGVKICDRWRDKRNGFVNFLTDMGDRPSGTTLDRIDPDGDYCPKNCRWATAHEQASNTRNQLGRVTGVYKRSNRPSWVASINIKSKGVRLTKSFSTKAQAIKQRREWERSLLD